VPKETPAFSATSTIVIFDVRFLVIFGNVYKLFDFFFPEKRARGKIPISKTAEKPMFLLHYRGFSKDGIRIACYFFAENLEAFT
jgi:hypothetical protein